MNRIEFDSEELAAAESWHGGQSSMLYALASNRALTRGTIRPRIDCEHCGGSGTERALSTQPCTVCRGQRGAPMTDAQWLAHLAGELESEASDSADLARTTAKRSRRMRERSELRAQALVLDGIAAKCRAAIAALGGE